MPKLSQSLLSTRTKVSLLVTVFLLGAIMISSFEAQKSRDFRTEAASCSSGQSTLTLRPTADFDNSLWSQVPATGSHFDKIDDTGQGDGDATYIWDDTPGSNTALARHNPVTLGSNQQIQRVIVNLRARLATGTLAQIAPTLYISGGEYYGTRTNVTGSYVLYGYSWNINPRTGAAWTATDVNNTLMAADSTRAAQPNALNLTQLWMEVCYVTIPPPTADIKANGSDGPISIPYNSGVTIAWSSSNASSCTIPAGGWSGTSGSVPTGNLTASRIYTLNCTGVGGSGSNSVVVNVSAPPPPPNPPPGGGGVKPPAPRPPVGPPKTTPPTPVVSTTAKSIVLRSGANGFLIGSKEVEVSIEGTSLTKKIFVTRDSQDYEIETTSLTSGHDYTLKVVGDYMLPQTQVFKLNAAGTNLSLQPLKVGDVTTDNQIKEDDAIAFLSGFLGDKFYDFNNDSVVNSFDYAILVNNIK